MVDDVEALSWNLDDLDDDFERFLADIGQESDTNVPDVSIPIPGMSLQHDDAAPLVL